MAGQPLTARPCAANDVPRRPSIVPVDSRMSARVIERYGRWMAWVAVIVMILSDGVALAPSARADSADNFRAAVASARSGTSCGPLRSNPIVEQAAVVTNRSTDDYLDLNAQRTPVDDPLPGLKILGYSGDKAVLLRGASTDDADAIKRALLQGYAYGSIPDCSYKDFGVSILHNKKTGYSLSSLVLAGP